MFKWRKTKDPKLVWPEPRKLVKYTTPGKLYQLEFEIETNYNRIYHVVHLDKVEKYESELDVGPGVWSIYCKKDYIKYIHLYKKYVEFDYIADSVESIKQRFFNLFPTTNVENVFIVFTLTTSDQISLKRSDIRSVRLLTEKVVETVELVNYKVEK